MKVTLQQIKMTQIEVEIPAVCPNCRTSFRSNGAENLLEDQWAFQQQSCRVRRTKKSELVRPIGKIITKIGYPIVTGYHCGKCFEILCSTDEREDVYVHHSMRDKHVKL